MNSHLQRASACTFAKALFIVLAMVLGNVSLMGCALPTMPLSQGNTSPFNSNPSIPVASAAPVANSMPMNDAAMSDATQAMYSNSGPAPSQQAAASQQAGADSMVQQASHIGHLPRLAPSQLGMPAISRGYTAPPTTGCPPRGAHGSACTSGCCNSCGPIYPTLPPMSTFGLDPQEFLCDGGDDLPLARVRNDDSFNGVGLEDTVVKYETADGGVHVTESNRVCIYAPRFASVRRVSGIATDALAQGPVGLDRPDGPNDVLAPQPSSAVMNPVEPRQRDLTKGPDALRARDLGVPVDNVVSLEMSAQKAAALANLSIVSDGVLKDNDRPWLAKGAAAAIAWSMKDSPQVAVDQAKAIVATRDVAAEGYTTYDLPNGKLRIIKLADRHSAQVGDIVTFVLRVDNTGLGPIDNVVLTDNLTTRLEYIADSQTCTKGVDFSTKENDGGSLQLTWNFTDDFEVGEAAIIRFRCRVR